MNIFELYKYSWFSNLAYLEWNDTNLSGKKAIDLAKSKKNTPENLGKEIFIKENYSVLSYHPNDDFGFKASLYSNDTEKVASSAEFVGSSLKNSPRA